MNKKYLHSLLQDKAVMENMANETASVATLEGTEEINPAQLEQLLSQNESAITDGPMTRTEAIILERGRPPLIVQDGKWEEPTLPEIRGWLKPARDSLLAAIPKVGRVEILNYRSDFVGTGWMIAEDLLITNRHVAELFGLRSGQAFKFRSDPFNGTMKVRVDFLREHDRANTAQFAVEEIKYIEENSQLRPDMALVRLNASGGTLPAPLELNSRLATREQTVAVIGYPAEDSRNDSFVMRNLFRGIYDVKRLCPGRIIGMRQDGKLLEHDSTTLGGASGSAVVDLSTGRVCGLHFGGEYKVSNVCVSSAWLRSRLAELEPLRISGLRGLLEGRLAAAPAAGGGGGGAGGGRSGGQPAASAPPPPPELEARPDVEAGRDGYDPEFLQDEDAAEPDESLRVPLPVLSTTQEAYVAPVKGSEDGLLHYTHFSLLMHKGRRLPFYTAVNINGNLLYNIVRGQDRWYTDLRLVDEKHQIGEDLYRANKLDRGHLVRRLDPTWGQTRAEAKQAEEDTFFFTNCSPQHSKLNQKTWLSLEEYILGNAGTHKLKVTVFSGPVMNEKDEEYRGVQLPEEFWKVVVVVNADTGRLSATGYVLSQRDYLGDLEFTYGDFNSYQVALTTIEEATGLSFNLSDYDPLHMVETSTPGRLILGAQDLVL